MSLQLLMALTLGMRHGLDLDHLATIDSMTRSISTPKLAQVSGLLFSLGHGLVVTLLSVMIGGGLLNMQVPQWLNGLGTGISIVFLFFFGFLTLWNVIRGSESSQAGIKYRMMRMLVKQIKTPVYVVSVGALFALSFDTFSQVALFSLSAKAIAGGFFAGILGIGFMIGMMAADGVNGFLIANVLQRADAFSTVCSKWLGVSIALFSLTIGILNISHIGTCMK